MKWIEGKGWDEWQKEPYQLRDEISYLSYRVSTLSNLLYLNGDTSVTGEELAQWSNELNDVVAQLRELQKDVYRSIDVKKPEKAIDPLTTV